MKSKINQIDTEYIFGDIMDALSRAPRSAWEHKVHDLFNMGQNRRNHRSRLENMKWEVNRKNSVSK